MILISNLICLAIVQSKNFNILETEYDLLDECERPADRFLVDRETAGHIFTANFDTTCDFCHLDLKTLGKAIEHYRDVHDFDEGYVKCCGLKIKRKALVLDHIRWHIKPEIFK